MVGGRFVRTRPPHHAAEQGRRSRRTGAVTWRLCVDVGQWTDWEGRGVNVRSRDCHPHPGQITEDGTPPRGRYVYSHGVWRGPRAANRLALAGQLERRKLETQTRWPAPRVGVLQQHLNHARFTHNIH
jgi:hypothetical protein